MFRYTLPHKRTAVVCSARSSHTKNEGTTTRLLRAAKVAGNVNQLGAIEEALSIVKDIKDDHLQAARSIMHSKHQVGKFEQIVTAECQSLVETLRLMQHAEGISLKTENTIISTGEKLACQYLTILLEDRGVPAHYVDLSDAISRHNISTSTLANHTYKALTDAFRQEVATCREKVPVVTGYFGNMPTGLLYSVGRG